MPSAAARKPFRVVIHGLPHFCQKLFALLRGSHWEIHYRSDLDPIGLAALARNLYGSDLAYTWGGRISMGKFLWAARSLGKQKVVMLWSGSDVLYAKQELASGKRSSWVAERTHWAVSPWIAEEVRSMGLSCEYVQASFVQPVEDPLPLPDNFSVLAYVPSKEKSQLYGWDQILEVARSLPSVAFTVVGLQQGESLSAPPNVRVHGWTSNLTPFLERATVLWRPVQHDGLSFMVLEALAQGRHVLYSYPFPGCIPVNGAVQARAELQGLLDLHTSRALRLNADGMQSIARDFAPAKVQADLLRRWEEIILSPGPGPLGKLAARGPKNAESQLNL
jgi:hypothetical protein